MKTTSLIIIGISISIIGLWITPYIKENGDWNSILMYFTIYGIVAVGIGIINGFYLKYVEKHTEKKVLLITFGLFPVVIFIGFIFSRIFRLTYIGEFGLIGIGVTNSIWFIKSLLKKP